MSNILELCDKVFAHLTAIGYPLRLEPGLSLSEIEDIQRNLPFKLPKAAVEMYQWRNGTRVVAGDTTLGACFFPWWCFDTITESLDRYNVLNTPTECVQELWNADWFPMFSGSDISSIGICCNRSQVDDGQMMAYHHTACTQLEYINLGAMLQTIFVACKAGAIFLGSDGELDYDTVEFSKIHKAFNPGVQRMVE